MVEIQNARYLLLRFLLASIRRSPSGSITPITEWILYADHDMAPICRSPSGSFRAVTDRHYAFRDKRNPIDLEAVLAGVILSP